MAKTIGKYSYKQYKCRRCGSIESVGTNHWGEIYSPCKNCNWKHPMDGNPTWDCLEPMPDGYDKPEPWKKVKLGDLIETKGANEMTDEQKQINELKEKYGESKNGHFSFCDVLTTPHPYCITPKHLEYCNGILSEYSIEHAESMGAKCGVKGCNLSYKEHEKVLLVSCKHPLKVKSDKTDEEMINPELHEWLKAINDQVTKDGYAGYAFKDDSNNPNKEVESNG